MTKHCFSCMKPIKGKKYREFRVKESFCHSSYWEREDGKEYGKLGNNGYGVLYECLTCNPDGEVWEGYEWCEGCNCMIADEDMDMRALEEFGEPWCKDCYLEEKGFKTKTSYSQIDAWRGHNKQTPVEECVGVAWDCCAIPHDQNEEFKKLIEEWLEKRGYEHIATFNQTSNVFSVYIQILAKKNRPLTEKEHQELHTLNELATDYYTRGFSIFSGKTYEINLEEFMEKANQI